MLRGFIAPTLALLMTPLDSPAQLKPGTPAQAGLSATRLDRAAKLLEEETASGRITAAALLVARNGVVAMKKGFGKMSPKPGAAATPPDAVFLLASITKPVTAVALMLLVERGQVALSDPVWRYLPEFKTPPRDQIRVRDLLTHTSGMPDMLPENTELRRKHAPMSQFVQGALTTPLLYPPGTDFTYQSMGILLAAEIVERVSKQPLRDFEKREIFDPLGMRSASLGMGGRRIEDTTWGQVPPSPDNDSFGWNSPYWRDFGAPWGGMHSSTTDIAILL